VSLVSTPHDATDFPALIGNDEPIRLRVDRRVAPLAKANRRLIIKLALRAAPKLTHKNVFSECKHILRTHVIILNVCARVFLFLRPCPSLNCGVVCRMDQ